MVPNPKGKISLLGKIQNEGFKQILAAHGPLPLWRKAGSASSHAFGTTTIMTRLVTTLPIPKEPLSYELSPSTAMQSGVFSVISVMPDISIFSNAK